MNHPQNDPFWTKAIETTKDIKTRHQLSAFRGVLIAFVAVTALSALAYLFHQWQGTRATYHITVTSLDIGGQPVNATVMTTAGGETLNGNRYNAIDFPVQRRPENGRITLYATAINSSLQGSADLLLGSDHSPTITIQLHRPPGAAVHGNVVDGNGKALAGVRVYVEGFPDSTVTSATGYFVLNTDTLEGQPMTLKAEKGGLVGQQNAVAGKDAEIVLRSQK